MKFSLLIILNLLLALITAAQSGRVKPVETPTPKPAVRPMVVYIPTQGPTVVRTFPTPTPTTKTQDGEEVIKVDSTLVPVPVSVLDAEGRAVMNLKLADFELKIDGKIAEISELTRSETPIRLAMLFDNSSSVEIRS